MKAIVEKYYKAFLISFLFGALLSLIVLIVLKPYTNLLSIDVSTKFLITIIGYIFVFFSRKSRLGFYSIILEEFSKHLFISTVIATSCIIALINLKILHHQSPLDIDLLITGLILSVFFLILLKIEVFLRAEAETPQCIKKSWRTLLTLVVIFIGSTLIKTSYWNLTFTGEHSQKYNGYVEPTLLMLKEHSYYPNNKLFESDPIRSFYGSYDSIGGNLPLTEWSVFASNTLLPDSLSLEFKTHFAMNVIGIALLFAAYCFCRTSFGNKEALIFTAILATQPLYQLLSYLTVADSFMFIFLILSLSKFFAFLRDEKSNNFFLSLLFGGTSVVCKDTSLIMLVPIIIFGLTRFKKLNQIVFFSILSIFLVISPKIFYFLTIYNLPKGPLLYSLLGLLPIGLYVFLYKKYAFILHKTDGISKKIYALILTLSTIIIFLLVRFQFERLQSFTSGFVISKDLLDVRFFEYLIQNKILVVMGPLTMVLGTVSLFAGLLYKKTRLAFALMFSSALCFFIAASKVIYFHTYYRFYFPFIACLFTAIVISKFSNVLEGKYQRLLVCCILVALFTDGSGITKDLLSKHKDGILEASSYVESNLKIDEFFMYNREAHVISIYSLRNSFDFRILNEPTFKNEIESDGIKNTFNKFKIKYYITTNPDPKYQELIAIFSKNIPYETQETLRANIILKEMNGRGSIFDNEQLRNEEIGYFDLQSHFYLEKQFGDYYIYRII